MHLNQLSAFHIRFEPNRKVSAIRHSEFNIRNQDAKLMNTLTESFSLKLTTRASLNLYR